MTREPAPANRRAVRATVVVGDDFHVEAILPSVDIPILDSAIGKMYLSIEEWEVVIVGPLRELALVAIGPAVSIGSAALALVEPLLVLALELIVQPHPVDLQSALFQACCLAFVGAVNLRVMFEFALPFQTGVERLTRVPVAVAAGLQQAPAGVRQDHRLLAMAGDANGLDQALLTEMSQIAVARIARPTGVISKIARGDDAKRSNRGKGSALGSA